MEAGCEGVEQKRLIWMKWDERKVWNQGRMRGSASLHLSSSSSTDLAIYLLLLGSSRCINRQEEHTARVKKRETSGGEGLV